MSANHKNEHRTNTAREQAKNTQIENISQSKPVMLQNNRNKHKTIQKDKQNVKKFPR